jgi:hypothetical protein
MSTKADLLRVWTKWTGDDVAETRHRIRALSEAGLLPRRRQPLDYIDIAHTLLGFTAVTQHKDAPESVRYYSDFRLGSFRFRGMNSDTADAIASPELFSEMTLVEALFTCLQPPFRLLKFEVNTTARTCSLIVGEGCRRIVTESGKRTTTSDRIFDCEYGFATANYIGAPASGVSTHLHCRVNLSRFVVFPLIDMLLTDLMGHPKPQYAGGPYAGVPDTKGAALPGATPHVEPPKPYQDADADPAGSSLNNSDSNEWVWPPQFNDPAGVLQ